ncbi:MAG: hypothetical protein AAB895_04145 [Patescibacteria group bacterium]
MRKERTLFILGLWIALLSFSGFPESWREFFFVLTGLAVMYIAYLFYMQAKKNMPSDESHSKTFVDNIGSGE